MSVFNIIESLSETSSRNEKIEILKKHKTNELFRNVVKLALDPFTNFYIKKIPKYRNGIPTMGIDEALSELSKLSSRQITGNAAIDFLREILSSLDEQNASVIEKVIQKDLRCGVAVGVVNAAWGSFISEYPCMLASQYDEKVIAKMKFPALVQKKLDGCRFNAIVRGSRTKQSAIEYRSRNGKEIIFNNPSIDKEFISLAQALSLDDVVFDGELLVANHNRVLDRQTGNGILNHINNSNIEGLEEELCILEKKLISLQKELEDLQIT